MPATTPYTRPFLAADTAAELMTPSPKSLSVNATVREAVDLFTSKAIGAAPVIDEAGHAVGVLSQIDLLIHLRENPPGTPAAQDQARVGDLMTPAVFSVKPETPAASVLEQLLALNVHHLFVVDDDGTVVGVIRAFDFLRHLRS